MAKMIKASEYNEYRVLIGFNTSGGRRFEAGQKISPGEISVSDLAVLLANDPPAVEEIDVIKAGKEGG